MVLVHLLIQLTCVSKHAIIKRNNSNIITEVKDNTCTTNTPIAKTPLQHYSLKS